MYWLVTRVGKLKNDVRQLNNMFTVPKFPIYVARLCLLPVSCFCQEIAYLQPVLVIKGEPHSQSL